MMKTGIPNIDVVTEDQSAYNLQGMVNPMFYNEGNTNVTVFGSTLPPGGQLSLDLPFVIGRKVIGIRFSDTDDQAIPKTRKLNVYFGTMQPC